MVAGVALNLIIQGRMGLAILARSRGPPDMRGFYRAKPPDMFEILGADPVAIFARLFSGTFEIFHALRAQRVSLAQAMPRLIRGTHANLSGLTPRWYSLTLAGYP